METVNLTPPAFAPSNPDAKKNMKAAEKAAIRLRNAVAAKAAFLDELVLEEFQGPENLLAGLIHASERIHECGVGRRLELTEVVRRYEAIQKEHSDASEALHGAFSGRR